LHLGATAANAFVSFMQRSFRHHIGAREVYSNESCDVVVQNATTAIAVLARAHASARLGCKGRHQTMSVLASLAFVTWRVRQGSG
jgi:hypothetical protein